MVTYNVEDQRFYGYVNQGTFNFNNISFPRNSWVPISTGPTMLAWGSLDSSAVVKAGSENFSVLWDESNRWFELNVPSASYSKDSMLLIITSVGNHSWDQ